MDKGKTVNREKTRGTAKLIPWMALLSILFCFGCSFEGAGNDLTPEKSYRTIQIEECEYLYLSRRPYSGEMALTHKGNCKNPIHRNVAR